MNDTIAVDVPKLPPAPAPVAVPKPVAAPLPSVPAAAPVSKFNEKPEPPKVAPPKPVDTKPAAPEATAPAAGSGLAGRLTKKNAVIGASALLSLAAGIAGVKFLFPGDETPEPQKVASKALNSGPAEPQKPAGAEPPKPTGPGVAIEREPGDQIPPAKLPVGPAADQIPPAKLPVGPAASPEGGPVAPPPSPNTPTKPQIPDGTSGTKPAPLPPSVHPDPKPSTYGGLPEPAIPLPPHITGTQPSAPRADKLGSPAPSDGFTGVGAKPPAKDGAKDGGSMPPPPDDLFIPVAPAAPMRPGTPPVTPVGGQTDPKKDNPVIPAVPAVPPATPPLTPPAGPMGGSGAPPLPELPALPGAPKAPDVKLPMPDGPKVPAPDMKLPTPTDPKPPVAGLPVNGSGSGSGSNPMPPVLPMPSVLPGLPGTPSTGAGIGTGTGTTGGAGTTGGSGTGTGGGTGNGPMISIQPPTGGTGGAGTGSGTGGGGPIVPAVPPDLVPPAIPKTPDFPATGGAKSPSDTHPVPPGKLEFPKPAGTPSVSPNVTPGSRAPERAPTTSYDEDVHQPTARDTWETVSREFYNDTRYAAALKAYNGNKALKDCSYVGVPPLHIVKRYQPSGVAPAGGTGAPVGTGSAAPAEWVGEKAYRVPTGGMTMMAIARLTLGSEQKWDDIAKLNPSLKPDDRLPAGTEVKLPAAARVPN